MEVVCNGSALSVVRTWFKDDDLGDIEQDRHDAPMELQARPARHALKTRVLWLFNSQDTLRLKKSLGIFLVVCV